MDQHELKLSQRLFAGATAGLAYWVGTYPLDVVKVGVSLQLALADLTQSPFTYCRPRCSRWSMAIA